MADILTAEQQAAVENRGRSLLVSAAAGSGKTKVLVEGEYVFIPVTTATGYPTLYAINTATGVATAGLAEI